jgi:hypothetical protein
MATSTIQSAGIELLPLNSAAETDDSVELLRQILAKEQRREVAYDEAADIGDMLIQFYEVLAEEVGNGFTA